MHSPILSPLWARVASSPDSVIGFATDQEKEKWSAALTHGGVDIMSLSPRASLSSSCKSRATRSSSCTEAPVTLIATNDHRRTNPTSPSPACVRFEEASSPTSKCTMDFFQRLESRATDGEDDKCETCMAKFGISRRKTRLCRRCGDAMCVACAADGLGGQAVAAARICVSCRAR